MTGTLISREFGKFDFNTRLRSSSVHSQKNTVVLAHLELEVQFSKRGMCSKVKL